MEWKLKDLTVDGKGSYGIGAPAVPYQENKLTYLRITDINDDGSLNFSDLKSVDAEDAEKYILKENDIVFARTGNSTGRSYFYEKQHGTFVYAGFLIKFSLDPNKVNPRILKYYTHSKPYFDWVNSFDTGATRGNINAKTYGDMEIELPSRKVQDKIVSILSSLDRKIELNNKINADLEEMAQAIFKNWFVDFEPFKDGKFVDSELGMIPEGWKVVTLDDLTSKFGTGLNPRKNFVLGHGNNYYVTIKNMGNNRIYLNDRCDKVDDEALAKINKRSKLQKGDLLFSGIGTIGRVAMVVDDPINWNTSESVFNMHPIDTVSSEFIYLLLLSDNFQQYVQQNAQGGVQQGIRMASLKAFQLAIPDDLNLFDNLVKPIISKIKSNDKENDTLSLLRDTLLPRLMSGEIEVPE